MPLNEIAIPEGRTPASAGFIETFVKPLENLNLALARNEPPTMAMEDMFALRERAERGDIPPVSVGGAKELFRVSLPLLAVARARGDEPRCQQVLAAAARLHRTLGEIVRARQMPTRGRRKTVRGRHLAQQAPVHVPMARLQDEARQMIVYEIHVHIHHHYPVRECTCGCGEERDPPPKRAAATPPPDPPDDQPPRRTRGKGRLGLVCRTGIANCPYVFKPDRCTIVFKPTGESYKITAPTAVAVVNRLTHGLKYSQDRYVDFSGRDAEALRSACPEFLRDCVEREGVDTGDGYRKLTGRARLVMVPKPRK